MSQAFRPAARADASLTADAHCYVFRRSDLLVRDVAGDDSLPRFADLPDLSSLLVRSNYIGEMHGSSVFAVEVGEDAPTPSSFAFVPLRASFGILGEERWIIAGRAAQVVEWARNHQFCGRCGSATDYLATELGKRCPECGLIAFPRVSPAVIVLVEDGDRVLLARGPHLAPEMYALIAGFVEAGESLEETVRREIREEVGIEVEEIRYFGSQSWPFPHSIMLGFTAQYRSGIIRIEPTELEDARWFEPDSMPVVPPRLSIARKLIDYYADKHGIELISP